MNQVLLSDVCEINPRMDVNIGDDTECSFVPMEYVDDVSGTIAQTDSRRVGEVRKGYTFFKDDDVIFAKITPCMENGKCAIGKNLKNGIAFGSTEFHVIRAKEEIVPEWIYYYLRQEHVRQSATHWFRGTAGQQRVPTIFLEELKIPLPPLTEQKRIASLLARADRLRSLRRTAHELSDSLLQSVFSEMFGAPDINPKGWDKDEFEKAIVSTQNGFGQREDYSPKGIIVLRIRDISSGKIDYSDPRRMIIPEKELSKYSLDHEDLILVRVNGNPNYVGIASKFAAQNEPIVFSDHVIRVKMDRKLLNTTFMVHLLNSPYGRKQTLGNISTTAGQFTINRSGLSRIKVIFPPLNLQEEFASVVARVEQMRARQAEGERQAQGLFEALLGEAFEQ